MFHAGIPENAAEKLRNFGILIEGEIVPNVASNTEIEEDEDTDDDTENLSNNLNYQNHEGVDYSALNLDVSRRSLIK